MKRVSDFKPLWIGLSVILFLGCGENPRQQAHRETVTEGKYITVCGYATAGLVRNDSGEQITVRKVRVTAYGEHTEWIRPIPPGGTIGTSGRYTAGYYVYIPEYAFPVEYIKPMPSYLQHPVKGAVK